MPNPRYQPSDPRFYEQQDEFASISSILGVKAPENEEEANVFLQNNDNLRAYLSSLLPKRMNERETTAQLLRICPAHTTENLDRRARRELHHRAQETIVNTAIRRHNALRNFSHDERLYRSLFLPQDGQELSAENQQILATIESGDPDALGRLFEQRIERANDFFNINYALRSDEFLVDNFENIHLCHDIVTNAQNILSAAEKKQINLSDNSIKTLQFMQKWAPKMDVPSQLTRIIANPMYEFVDFRQLDNTSFGRFYMLEDALPDMDRTMNDYLQWYRIAREWDCIVGETALWERIGRDFPSGQEHLQISYLDDQNKTCKLGQIGFNPDSTKQVIGKSLTNSPVVVRDQAGNVSCYRYENGTVKSMPATRLRDQFVDNLRADVLGVVDMLDKANRGLFWGSQEYRDVRSDMKQLKELALGLSDPPGKEQLDALNAMLVSTAASCDAYMDTKDFNNLGTVRTARRYYAVEAAKHLCMKNQLLYSLQDMAVQSELSSIMNYSNPGANRAGHRLEYPSYSLDRLMTKLQTSYGAQGGPENSQIPESDVGNIADELRASIHLSLTQMLTNPTLFNAKDARNVMSDMVVLEMVKAGRTVSALDNILAGPVERSLSQNPVDLLHSFRRNPSLQAMTQDVSPEMFHHFLMTDGAKNMAQAMTKQAAYLPTEMAPGINPLEIKHLDSNPNQLNPNQLNPN